MCHRFEAAHDRAAPYDNAKVRQPLTDNRPAPAVSCPQPSKPEWLPTAWPVWIRLGRVVLLNRREIGLDDFGSGLASADGPAKRDENRRASGFEFQSVPNFSSCTRVHVSPPGDGPSRNVRSPRSNPKKITGSADRPPARSSRSGRAAHEHDARQNAGHAAVGDPSARAVGADEEWLVADLQPEVLHGAEDRAGCVVCLDPAHQPLAIVTTEGRTAELGRRPIGNEDQRRARIAQLSNAALRGRAIRQLRDARTALILIPNRSTTELGRTAFGRDYCQRLMRWIETHYTPCAIFGPVKDIRLQIGDKPFFIRPTARADGSPTARDRHSVERRARERLVPILMIALAAGLRTR